MIRLSDKVRLIFAILGASSMLVSMYLIPFLKTETQFWGNIFIYFRCFVNCNFITKS